MYSLCSSLVKEIQSVKNAQVKKFMCFIIESGQTAGESSQGKKKNNKIERRKGLKGELGP